MIRFILRGIKWKLYFAPWSEWHGRDSEPRVRRAWWWLRQWPLYGSYCLRVVGITLYGRRAK